MSSMLKIGDRVESNAGRFGVVQHVNKHHSSGSPVYTILWDNGAIGRGRVGPASVIKGKVERSNRVRVFASDDVNHEHDLVVDTTPGQPGSLSMRKQ